jgi:RimJ/RimL family protein N-acetyltransferase
MYEHRKTVKDMTVQIFQSIKKHGGFRRIQTAVQEDWETARRFAEACGMKYEGRMPYYGIKGEHFVRYAITDEE